MKFPVWAKFALCLSPLLVPALALDLYPILRFFWPDVANQVQAWAASTGAWIQANLLGVVLGSLLVIGVAGLLYGLKENAFWRR